LSTPNDHNNTNDSDESKLTALMQQLHNKSHSQELDELLSSIDNNASNPSNSSAIDKQTRRVLDRMLDLQGICRISSIQLEKSRLAEFLQYYSENIKPIAYKDPGFIEALLLLKETEDDSIVCAENITLWKDKSSIERNNQHKDYQHAMNGIDQFMLQTPTLTQFKLAQTVPSKYTNNTAQSFDEKISHNTDDAQALFQQAKELLELNNSSAAFQNLNRILSLNSVHRTLIVETHTLLAKLYNEKALQHLNSATAQPNLRDSKEDNNDSNNTDPMASVLQISGNGWPGSLAQHHSAGHKKFKNNSKNNNDRAPFPPINTGVSYS
jgi:quinol monooxygenase YgiN